MACGVAMLVLFGGFGVVGLRELKPHMLGFRTFSFWDFGLRT